jgi:[acyl-carrier-protein] S-malonyltransferase
MKPFALHSCFPGQGSQAVGMLDAWGDHLPCVTPWPKPADALGEDMAG